MKKYLLGLLASFLSLFGMSAFAVAPTTVAELTAGIALDGVTLGILAISAVMAAVYVTWRSAGFVLKALKGF